MDFSLIVFISLLSTGLQAPTLPANEGISSTPIMPENETVITGADNASLPLTSCPRYEHGNPSGRNLTGCTTGTSLEPVDHVAAFGFNSGENPDWNACGLPRLPEKK